MKMENKKKALILNVACILLQIIAILTYVNRYGGSPLFYYTTLSNYIALFSSILYIFTYFTGKFRKFTAVVRYTSLMMLVITFLVVVFVLVWYVDPVYYLFTGSAGLRHTVIPGLSFVSYMFYEEHIETAKEIIPTFVVSVVYTAIMLVLNSMGIANGPYPFLMVLKFGWGRSILYCVLILAVMVSIACLLHRISGKIRKK